MYRTSRKIVLELAVSTREKESWWDERKKREREKEKKEREKRKKELEAFRTTKGTTDDAAPLSITIKIRVHAEQLFD